MAMKTELRTEIPVSLKFPVPVRAEDGKKASRNLIVVKRPRTRHAKRLAALFGAEIVSELMGQLPEGADTADSQIDGRRLVADLLPKLMTSDRLDALTGIVADMCDEDPALIDDLDLVDLVELGKAFLGFFPALRSLAPGP
jgi:hypothetical protein